MCLAVDRLHYEKPSQDKDSMVSFYWLLTLLGLGIPYQSPAWHAGKRLLDPKHEAMTAEDGEAIRDYFKVVARRVNTVNIS
jgi:hypothetical protein